MNVERQQNSTMLHIDGAQGEGGGQILRSALALSLVTGQPFEIVGIRAGRTRPGLMRQHLTAVRAAAAVGQADVQGCGIGAQQVCFAPGSVQAGTYHFAVGTAGSAVLVLQTVLPALMLADGPSRLVLEGGTHNPAAPPFDFLDKAFLPLLRRMGPRVSARLEQRGFYPAGGGRFVVEIEPATTLVPLELMERGAVVGRQARAIVAHLPRHIATREIREVQARLSIADEEVAVEEVRTGRGPGNVLLVELRYEHLTEVFTGFGECNRSAEAVARRVSDDVRQYLVADVPVGRYLADQLLLPLALAGRGCFRTLPLSRHAQTNIAVIRQFLDVAIAVTREGRTCEVTIG